MTDRLPARAFLALLTDDFAELPHPGGDPAGGGPEPDGPLGWPGYGAQRARASRRTGETESVVCGTGHVEGVRAVLLAFEFGFLGGSLGRRTGDRLEAAYAYAREHRLPVVPLVATGGSRMQEGMFALTQLQRVARQSALTREAGLPQIAVLRDPATGGGWRRWARAPTWSSRCPAPRWASPAPGSGRRTPTRRRTPPRRRWRRAARTPSCPPGSCAGRWGAGCDC